MNPDPFQQAWKAESTQTRVTIDIDSLSKEVQRSQQGFQSMILWRDVREAGTALLLIPVWLVMGLASSQPWSWYLSLPVFVWIAAFILVDRRRHPQRPSAPGEPLGFYAKESLVQVEHQIWLLRNVHWWYLLPSGLAVMAYFLHVSWQISGTWWLFVPAAIFWSLFVLVIYGAIYWLNQFAVRKTLEPRRQDLLKLVASLEDESNSEHSGDIMELVSNLTDPTRCGNASWESWAGNWNRIVPTWSVAAWIILPTLLGACCGLCSGLWLRIPEMGPTFFQAVVGAVIPFEIALGYAWLLFYRKQKQNMSSTSPAVDPSAILTVRRTPKAPAMSILVLTILMGVLAVLAVLVFFIEFKGGSVPGLGGSDVAPFHQGEIANLDGWPNESANKNSANLNETVGRESNQSKEIVVKLAELCRKHDVPAMTAAVVNTNGLVNSACFGVRKRGTSDNVELSDRFPLGGCTAPLTATLAAVLVETGKIDWNTTIGDVWPQATDEDLHPQLRTVTLDQLLSHQSGLPGNISDISRIAWASFFDEKLAPPLERRRMLKLVLSQAPTQSQGKFSHSNLGFAIASAMMETRAGESFESLMKRLVFIPLEMSSAYFHSLQSAERLEPPLLWSHRASGAPVDPRSIGSENPTVYAATGTVHVSIEDFVKYARWHLAGKPAPLLETRAGVPFESLMKKHVFDPLAMKWCNI